MGKDVRRDHGYHVSTADLAKLKEGLVDAGRPDRA